MSTLAQLSGRAVLLTLIAVWYAALSLVAFVTFAFDKSRAKRVGASRVPERTLHVLSGMGGFPGSMAAMWRLRHKNRKFGFVMVTIGLAGLHVGAWVLVILWRAGVFQTQ